MSMAFLTIPLMIFVVFILPIWLFFHYRSKNQISQGLSHDDFQRLQFLTERTERLQQRVHTLERILDDDAPNWRAK